MEKTTRISPKACVVCGTVYQPKSWNSYMTPMCSPECKEVVKQQRQKRIETPCLNCGILVLATTKLEKDLARKGRAYCSGTCKVEFLQKLSSETMARTNHKYASERMKTKNPMSDPAAKAKQSATLRAMGWKPPVRGGNGELTVPQKLLADALGWPTEVPVLTGATKGRGFPTSLKIDIANEALKIAIEVDGNSHKTVKVKAADKTRDEFLTASGWTVLRFWNHEVTENLEKCVQTVTSTISKLKETTTTS